MGEERLAMTDASTRRLLAEAALKRAAAKEWRRVSLHELAALARRPLGDFYPLTAADSFDCVDEYFDRAAADGLSAPDRTGEPRDRVFDAAMARFEAMESQRRAVLSLDKAIEREPLAQAAALARTARTARWLLALAGEDGEGVGAAARAQSLALVLRQARAAWAREETGDFAKTMAALDSGLRRADSFFESVGKMAASFRPPRPGAGKPAAEEPPASPPAAMPQE
jgi:hypothetical protein